MNLIGDRSLLIFIKMNATIVFISLFFASSCNILGCGIDWSSPQNHFPFVNEKGNLSYWNTVGDIALDDGLDIPLNFGFNPAWNRTSPYLGKDWLFPLLESNIVQLDDNIFLLTLPSGLKIRLHRENSTDTHLVGAGGWMAELGENTATVWAECGWKLIFDHGKITSLTGPQNQQLNYIYTNDTVSEIDQGSKQILSVTRDSSGTVSGISFGNNKISFAKGKMPQIETLNSKHVIGKLASSLSKIILNDNVFANFQYNVTNDLNPSLTVSGAKDQVFTWDPSNYLIISDSAWHYDIKPNEAPFANAAITRTNKTGNTEYWFDDKLNGMETVRGTDGITIVQERFASGLLKGKLRKVSKIENGTTTISQQYMYDESGKVVRATIGTETYIFSFNDHNQVQAITSGNQTVWQKQ